MAKPDGGQTRNSEQRKGLTKVRRVTASTIGGQTRTVILKSRPDLLPQGLSKVRQASVWPIRDPTSDGETYQRSKCGAGKIRVRIRKNYALIPRRNTKWEEKLSYYSFHYQHYVFIHKVHKIKRKGINLG